MPRWMRLPPLDGCVAVCLALTTIEVYGCTNGDMLFVTTLIVKYTNLCWISTASPCHFA